MPVFSGGRSCSVRSSSPESDNREYLDLVSAGIGESRSVESRGDTSLGTVAARSLEHRLRSLRHPCVRFALHRPSSGTKEMLTRLKNSGP